MVHVVVVGKQSPGVMFKRDESGGKCGWGVVERKESENGWKRYRANGAATRHIFALLWSWETEEEEEERNFI